MVRGITIASVGSGKALLAEDTVAVELYAWQAASPYYDSGNKIGDFTNAGDGRFFINVTTTIKATVVVDGQIDPLYTGVLFFGDDVPFIPEEY